MGLAQANLCYSRRYSAYLTAYHRVRHNFYMITLHDILLNFPLDNIRASVYAFILSAATLVLKENKML